ncbi:MAG: transposase [Alphaproteobacteria bacterium]
MRQSRFIEDQIIAVLREQEDGASASDVCCKRTVSSATFCKSTAKSGGMDVSDARRPRSLEDNYTGFSRSCRTRRRTTPS